MNVPVVEKRFEYKGFPCVVLFTELGFRNGYVGVPKGHRYYGAKYDCIPVSCHGGLTYSYDHLHHQTDVGVWWIGFDCGHFFDGFDLEKLEEYFPNNIENQVLFDYHRVMTETYGFRTLEYVEEQCKGIVDQLLRASEE